LTGAKAFSRDFPTRVDSVDVAMAKGRFLKLSELPQPRSAARTALAEVILKRKAAADRVAAVSAAIHSAMQNRIKARAELEAASAAIDEARQAETDRAISAALNEKPASKLTLKDARARLDAAQDELDALVAAGNALDQELPQAEAALSSAVHKVSRLAKEVITAEAKDRLVVDFVTAHRTYLQASAALTFIDCMNVALGRHDYPDLLDGAQPWRDTLARLENDADTPLP
jgi:chromosome segregation ATPase